MGIRIANEDEIKEIAKKQQTHSVTTAELNITQEELEYLYSKSILEIKELDSSMEKFKATLKDFFWSKEIFDLDIINLFFESLLQLIRKQLPAILEGDSEIITEISNGELDEDDIDKIRIKLYQALAKKYLNDFNV